MTESTALATRESEATAHALVAAPMFTPEQERMLREMYAPTASDLEFEVLLSIAKARRLNPLLGQIHFVKRNAKDGERWVEKWSCQVAIDGFRAKAEETGLYDGQDEPELELDDDGGPVIARVRVYRKGIARPFVGVARWEEFVQTKNDKPTHMWRQMPTHMLAKCAEALALRKAFPEQLGGLYTPEEMGQAENPPKPWRVVAGADPGPHTGHRAKLPPGKPPSAKELGAAIDAAKTEIDCAEACERALSLATQSPKLRGHAYGKLISVSHQTALPELVKRVRADTTLAPETRDKLSLAAEERAAALADAAPAEQPVSDDYADPDEVARGVGADQ